MSEQSANRARVIVHRLRGIREPALRRSRFKEFIEGNDPGEVVRILDDLFTGTVAAAPDFDLVFADLGELLVCGAPPGPIDYAVRSELYVAARDGNLTYMSRLLLESGRPNDVVRDAPRLPPDLARMTLGFRRSLGKKPDREMIRKMLADHDPVVIRNLLNNPRALLQDVLIVASRRPNQAPVLREIYVHPRWSHLYEVRLALARNPWLPVEMGLKLIPLLKRADIRSIAADGTLAGVVRMAAAETLARAG